MFAGATKTSGTPLPTRSGVFDFGEGFTLVNGANPAAILREVGVMEGATAPVVVHAMRDRDKFLR